MCHGDVDVQCSFGWTSLGHCLHPNTASPCVQNGEISETEMATWTCRCVGQIGSRTCKVRNRQFDASGCFRVQQCRGLYGPQLTLRPQAVGLQDRKHPRFQRTLHRHYEVHPRGTPFTCHVLPGEVCFGLPAPPHGLLAAKHMTAIPCSRSLLQRHSRELVRSSCGAVAS